DGPLPARLFESHTDLLAVEGHARAVLLDHLQRSLDLLVRREPAAALGIQTFAAATDDERLAGTRVDHIRLAVPAEGTHHGGAFPYGANPGHRPARTGTA